MADLEEALQNPFSKEKALHTFRENMSRATELRAEIDAALAAGTGEDRDLVLKAAEALGRLTDNTILERLVRQALEARDQA
ncbi:MAG: hypothetical protein IJ188_06110 [Clostridia bacterium]|nr:hypothetical protein [Clostridia bacterium]MBQ9252190.1 hypothetical protein [Clostridia bacterium]